MDATAPSAHRNGPTWCSSMPPLSDATLWNPIASQLAAAHRRSLVENARTFALLNMALSDAGVAVMDTKYHYNFWRPETAIVRGATDGNDRTDADASFVPFIAAPCFPSYPSGHASTSYAAREVLERTFGRRGHSIVVSSPAVPEVVLEYTAAEGYHSRHRRRPGLRRHPLPLRPGRRRRAGAASRRVCVPPRSRTYARLFLRRRREREGVRPCT